MNTIASFVSSPKGKWITLVVWLLGAVVLVSQLPQLSDAIENEQTTFLPVNSESTQAFLFETERFPSVGTPVLIVIHEPEGLSSTTWAAVDKLNRWLISAAAPSNIGQGQVRAPTQAQAAESDLVSPDQTTLYVFLDMSGEPTEPEFTDSVNAIRAQIDTLDLQSAEIALGGPGGLLVDLVATFDNINSLLLFVTVALVLVLLMLIYRSPVVAFIPLASVGLVFALAGAVGAGVAERFNLPLSEQTTGIMTVVLFGTGTDYVLFISARFREELGRIANKHEAMRTTIREVGGAVASAGLTILIASAALGFATFRAYRSLGPVIAIAVALMMLAALTLVPAVLTILGRRAFWPKQPQFQAVNSPTDTPDNWQQSLYGKIGKVVLSKPRVTLAITVGVLGILILGMTRYETNYDEIASLPSNTESVRSFELLREGFPPGELAPTYVYVDLPADEQVLQPKALQQIDEMTLSLANNPRVADVSGPSRPFGSRGPPGGTNGAAMRFISADGGAARLSLVLKENPYSSAGLEAVPPLREAARSAATTAGLNPASVLVGGETAATFDSREAANRDNLVVLPLVLLAIGLVLALLLRSLIAPLYLLATIVFTYFATLGLAVFVSLNIFDHVGVGPSVPFFLFIFLNALSVDYNIYLMSRIREEAREVPTKEAVGRALARTGPVITSAGLILAGTFSALMVLPLEELVQLGFAVAAGVLIDTFITRTLIVPALVSMFGRWNWWPSRVG